MKLRIAHISATFPPYRGGTGNVCWHNVRELAARGHAVTVFTPTPAHGGAAVAPPGVRIKRLRPWLRFGNAAWLPTLLTQLHDFDVIHLHYPFFGGELSAVAAQLARVPLVITYHQDVVLPGWQAIIERVARATLGRYAIRQAARVLFTSADYAQASKMKPYLRQHTSHSGVLPNGVDCRVFQPCQAAHVPAMTHEPWQVLLVASLDQAHYFKGVHVLLEALALCPPPISAVIVGDGALRSHYEQLAVQLGLAQRVSFAGRVADAELPSYYQQAAVTVLPSITMGEAFGLVLLESLACGTPVIASRLPGVRTVVREGQDGYLVPPGAPAALAEALLRLYADPGLRQRMGQAGRLHVEQHYSWSQVVNHLELIYQTVLDEAGRDQGFLRRRSSAS